jgi:predicted Fe-S protein YdhL (DUF1289 family)
LGLRPSPCPEGCYLIETSILLSCKRVQQSIQTWMRHIIAAEGKRK